MWGFEEIYRKSYQKITATEMPPGSQMQTNNPRIHLLAFTFVAALEAEQSFKLFFGSWGIIEPESSCLCGIWKANEAEDEGGQVTQVTVCAWSLRERQGQSHPHRN